MIPLYKPIYLPQNSEAQALIDELANELCLTLNGKTGLKHRAILPTFQHMGIITLIITYIIISLLLISLLLLLILLLLLLLLLLLIMVLTLLLLLIMTIRHITVMTA